MLNKEKEVRGIGYIKLLRFFLPLAATPFLVGLAHSIANAALARLPLPEMSLAAYAVARGITMILASPALISLQLVSTFVDDSASYQIIKKFAWTIATILFLIMFSLGYTPLGAWVFTRLMGLPGTEQISLAYAVMRITCFLPFVQVLRNTNQGLALNLKKTELFIPGIILRLLFISTFLWWAVSTRYVLGVMAAAISWVGGIGLEGVFIILSLRYFSGVKSEITTKLPPRNEVLPVGLELIKFFIPLAIMMALTAFAEPVVQSGLARSSNPTISLAAYGVAWTLMILFTGPLRSLHQLSLVFVKGVDDPNWSLVKRFSLCVGVIISIIFLLLALSPLGEWVLSSVIAVSDEITAIARWVLLVFVPYPILRVLRETYWGLMMRQRRTTYIAVFKVINTLVIIAVLYVSLNTLSIYPAAIGGLAFIVSETIETILIWRYSVTSNQNSASMDTL